MPLSSAEPEKGNGKKSIEDRVERLERITVHLLACLGMTLTADQSGQLGGYQIPVDGSGILTKVLNDLREIKDQRKIIIPGRH